MQANINMPATPSFNPRHEPSQRIDPEPSRGAPSDLGAAERLCEDRLIRLWYSAYSDSFVK